MRYRFGPFELHRDHGRLLGPGGEIRLRAQAYRVLEVLVVEAPRIVGGDELVDRAWDVDFVSAATVRQTLSELRQALGDDARDPRFIETVHRRGYRMVARVEARTADPDKARDPSPTEASLPDRVPPPLHPGRPGRGLVAVAVTGLVLILGTLVGAPVADRSRDNAVAASGTGLRLRLELENLSADPQADWMAGAIEHLLRAELAVLASIDAMAGAVPLRRHPSQRLPAPGRDDEAARRRPDGSGMVARGSFLVIPGDPRQELQLQVQILDATTGAHLGWARESGRHQELPRMVRRLARSIGAAGGARAPRDRALWAQLDLASSTESLRLFAKAMDRMRRADDLAARPLLEQAVIVDPDNPLHHEALATVYDHLGFEQLAAAQAMRAAHMVEGLPREQQLLVFARRDELSGDYPEAATSLRALYQQYPNEREYGLRLTNVLLKAGRFREAQAITHQLGLTGQAEQLDTRLALLDLRIKMAGHRLREAETLARQLIEGGVGRASAPVVTTIGLQELAKIYLRIGNLDGAEEVLRELEEQVPAGHRLQVRGFVELGWGDLLGRRGLLEESTGRFLEAADTFRSLGDISSESGVLNRMAFLLHSGGRPDEAVRHLEQAIALNRRGHNLRGLAVSLSLIADALAAFGHVDEARRAIDESLGLTQSMDDHRRQALSHRCLGRVLAAEGRLREAEASFRSSLDLSLAIGDRSSAAQAIRGLGSIAGKAGRRDEARAYLGEAAAAFQSLHLLPHLLGTQMELAQLALLDADARRSRRLFTDVLERARETELAHYVTEAEQGLAQLRQRERI